MNCRYCGGECIKKGKIELRQRYQCKRCLKYQQNKYRYDKTSKDEPLLIKLNNESVGISSIGRIMQIPKTTVQRTFEHIAGQMEIKIPDEQDQLYEIDELRTYCRNKKTESWVMYAINKASKNIITACIGRRTKENLKKIIDVLLSLRPKKICTDRLNIYPSLIPQKIHKVYHYSTNHIERKNLTLRTHLKRQSRKTLCYTKSNTMLENCLKIYAGQGKDRKNALLHAG